METGGVGVGGGYGKAKEDMASPFLPHLLILILFSS